MHQLGRIPNHQVPPVLVPDEPLEAELVAELVDHLWLEITVELLALPHPLQVEQDHTSVHPLQLSRQAEDGLRMLLSVVEQSICVERSQVGS